VPNFERVYTTTDWYDGPRIGIADFEGKPHLFVSRFDTSEDSYSDVFELREVDTETLRLALEDWGIWTRWENAFHAGQTTKDTHPALPEDRARHEVVARMLEQRLAALSNAPLTVRGEFRAVPGKPHGGRGRWMEVSWERV
jgi:hypothetical protein